MDGQNDVIGHEWVGTGPNRVIVLNDWIGDTSTWDGAKPYLNQTGFSWVFADLRGYGRSRLMDGPFGVGQSATDVLRLADSLSWDSFAILGHSMSSIVALHLAQHFGDRIRRAVALTPVPPTGAGADDAMLIQLRRIASGDDAYRLASLKALWGDRISNGWVALKVERWRAVADPAAVASYVDMFARDGLPEPSARIAVPVLVITGEQDAEFMRQQAVTRFLTPLCDQLTIVPFAQCGHYPMQEMPPLLVATLERFLLAQ